MVNNLTKHLNKNLAKQLVNKLAKIPLGRAVAELNLIYVAIVKDLKGI